MARFVIAPHMRLHEWVAEEKGYFADAGLDYEFRDELRSASGRRHDLGDRVGAYQTIEKGRTSDVSCACHWTVNVAASVGHGKLYADCYSVAPAGIFVPADSPVTAPEQLAGVPISVGYQSGSHYSAIQALEQYMPHADISLSFADGLLFRRMEKLIDREVPAVSLFSGPYYFAEQLRLPQGDRHHIHDGVDDHRQSGHGRCTPLFRCSAACTTRYRSASGAVHQALPERIPRALPCADGHAALGTGRTSGVRALHQGCVRTGIQLDCRSRDLRKGPDGSGTLRIRHLCRWREAERVPTGYVASSGGM